MVLLEVCMMCLFVSFCWGKETNFQNMEDLVLVETDVVYVCMRNLIAFLT